MKKCVFVVLLIALTTVLLTACSCEHEWTNASCTEPVTCTKCGETAGEALGHKWVDANCITAKTCSVCNATEGGVAGHTWTDATCTTPKTCSACNIIEGDALGHKWVDASCITAKTCSVCNATEGDALGHTWISATCTVPKTCSVCKVTEGGAGTHNWKKATCTAPKTCTICNMTEGEKGAHNWKDATCTTPQTCSVCNKTKGSALGHTNNGSGFCDSCGAHLTDIKLQKMSALGIDAAYDSAKFPSTLQLSAVTYEDIVNGHGDTVTRMVLQCYAANSFGGYGTLYIVVLCCEYETDYLEYEWDGLYFTTSAYNNDPGTCDYTLSNESAMSAYKKLIKNPKEIPYD